MENENLQELSIVVQDRIRYVSRGWWYALALTLILIIPIYFTLRYAFTKAIVANHRFPAFIYQTQAKEPLEVSDKKIFSLGGTSYSGYFKIHNSNLEYGTLGQSYEVIFYTMGGTEITRVQGSTFVLPSSDKIVVIPKFASDKQPSLMDISLGETKFVLTDKPQPNLELQRVGMNNVNGQFVVAAGIKNLAPFTIRQVNLPVVLYDNSSRIVGVNYTTINDLQYLETRTFQFTWPSNPGAVRAEILPEVNILDNNIYVLPPGQSQFDTPATSE